MRRLKWRSAALADLGRIHEWLSTIEGVHPDRTILRIRAAAQTLRRLGDIGRPSRVECVRELSVRNAPYVIVYTLDATTVDIRAVYHQAQKR
jgi:plasmid stabilization system protein ParE